MSQIPQSPAAAPSAAGAGAGEVPSYDGDIAAMSAMVAHLDGTLLPHLDLLAAQAQRAGNGAGVLAALATATERVNLARDAAQAALAQVRHANEAVRHAYADAADEAAKDKHYLSAE